MKHRVRNENLASISALQEKILRDPETMKRILSDLSINITEMFRDPSFFKTIRKNVIPFVRDYPDIRIWHVGCSTGEEVYSMAILLHEEGALRKSKNICNRYEHKYFRSSEERNFSFS